MPRHKSATNCQILPWLSAKQDCREGRFLQCGNSLFFSPEFQSLSAGSKHLYLCMALEAGGGREFEFPRKAAAKFGFSETSFDRYKRELVEKKFVEVASSGKNTRTPNRYRFVFGWKLKPERPP